MRKLLGKEELRVLLQANSDWKSLRSSNQRRHALPRYYPTLLWVTQRMEGFWRLQNGYWLWYHTWRRWPY